MKKLTGKCPVTDSNHYTYRVLFLLIFKFNFFNYPLLSGGLLSVEIQVPTSSTVIF